MGRARHLIVGILLVALLVATPSSQAAEPTDLETRLPDELTFSNATLLVGVAPMSQAAMNELGAVNLRTLDLPEGTLYVCPADQGQQDELPPLPVVEARCRGEESYEDPTLEIRDRTWLRTRGNLSLQQAPNASLTMLWAPPNASLQWGASLSHNPFAVNLDDSAWALQPTVGSSQIHIESNSAQGTYNGTHWIFYFQGAGVARIGAQGAYATFQQAPALAVRQAPIEALASALEPRRLLDVQSAVRGADAREPTRNVTRLFDAYGRIPHLSNGALFGHLEGRLGERSLEGEGLTLIRAEQLVLQPTGDRLSGQGEVKYTRTPDGFGTGASDPHAVAWWLALFVWVPALIAVRLRPGPVPKAWHAWAGGALLAAALFVFDLRLGSVLGTNAWGLATGDARLGYVLAFVGFELVALGLGWLVCYLPLRLTVERLVSREATRFTRSGLAVFALGVILLLPGELIVVGQWLARL